MRVIITGAGGLVGSALSSAVRGRHEVTALTHADLDITDREAISRIVRATRPELIINCAVIGVDQCEEEPIRATAINVDGPALLADAASACGAGMVHFSSNYVFGGDRALAQSTNFPRSRTLQVPGRSFDALRFAAPAQDDSSFYTIDDDPQPVNVYGKTKLAGELAVAAHCARAFIIRTSWVFGKGKVSFLSTVHRRLLAGEGVRAIRDVWASTTWVDDLVERAVAIFGARRYGTYHVVNGGVCSYEDFAREAGRLVGISDENAARLIESVNEEDVMRAPRPRYTPMRCLMSERAGFAPLRDWPEALGAYLHS